jgi:uncharacterized protein YjbJ (UPF0337 family)
MKETITMAKDHRSEGLIDKAVGRVKKAAGDLKGDEGLRREGGKDENRGKAREELQDAQEQVERKSQEVANRK